jgi:hypothetical protein
MTIHVWHASDLAARVTGRAVASSELIQIGDVDGSSRIPPRTVSETGSRSLTVRFTSYVWVRGRVVRFGVPLAGARVDVPPDPDVYGRAADPYDVGYDGVPAETVTGRDGRFQIALPPGGAAEVRVTFQRVTARRPVARSGPATIDLGDIDLPAAIRVSLTCFADESCQLMVPAPCQQ